MFENLRDRLQQVFQNLRQRGKLSEDNIIDGLREVQVALLEADVNYKVVKEFISKVRKEAVGEKVIKSITPSQQIVKIVQSKLTELLGGKFSPLSFSSSPPTTFMLVGLQGSGKTTTAGKLAKFCESKGHRVLLVGTDTRRPAAKEQLKMIGDSLNLPVVTEGKTPLNIAKASLSQASSLGKDVIIVDTQGRLHIDKELMGELVSMKKVLKPQEVLLVVDSMTGQDAVNVAKGFKERLELNGVILSKMDSDARGGAALSIRAVANTPLKFVGTGEKMEDLEPFHPERMASRILGMGDVVSLVEKAEEQIEKEEAEKLVKKIKTETFDLEDFLEQMRQMEKMGSLSQMLEYLPADSSLKNVDFSEERHKQVEAIILSMTKEERSNPKILNGSRRSRIARGSGTTVQEVNQLLQQFFTAKKMMKEIMKKGQAMKGRGWLPRLS